MTGTRASLEERLWRRVDIGDPEDCWPWQGFRTSLGYGQIGVGPAECGTTATHRVAWEVIHGPIPEGLIIRHKCDNPPCCNPAHLEVGTAADNSRDKIERGRAARGSRLPHTRLSEEDVVYIRANYWREGIRSNSHELAAQFGVRREHICAIARGARRGSVIHSDPRPDTLCPCGDTAFWHEGNTGRCIRAGCGCRWMRPGGKRWTA
jgi:hypothetical protein